MKKVLFLFFAASLVVSLQEGPDGDQEGNDPGDGGGNGPQNVKLTATPTHFPVGNEVTLEATHDPLPWSTSYGWSGGGCWVEPKFKINGVSGPVLEQRITSAGTFHWSVVVDGAGTADASCTAHAPDAVQRHLGSPQLVANSPRWGTPLALSPHVHQWFRFDLTWNDLKLGPFVPICAQETIDITHRSTVFKSLRITLSPQKDWWPECGSEHGYPVPSGDKYGDKSNPLRKNDDNEIIAGDVTWRMASPSLYDRQWLPMPAEVLARLQVIAEAKPNIVLVRKTHTYRFSGPVCRGPDWTLGPIDFEMKLVLHLFPTPSGDQFLPVWEIDE